MSDGGQADRDLEHAFRSLREAERREAPGFRRVVEGRVEARRAWPPVLGWLAAGSAVAVALLFVLPARSRSAELELAREVLAWRSPTDFLLPPSIPDVLTSVPDLRRAVAGSPLVALDPGGELGPPATSRSPQ